jgi:hypothetical protein
MSHTGSAVSAWRKSIRCESQQCVEVAQVDGRMAIRNSTDTSRHLIFEAAAWQTFMTTLRDGAWKSQ